MKKVSALVIDNDMATLSQVQALLQAEGIHCETAASGQEGLQKISQRPFDLIFLNLILPDLDGETVLGTLHSKLPQTHIVVLSVEDDEESIRSCIALGAKAYMVKPCSEKTILDCIRNVERHRTADELRTADTGTQPPPPEP